MRQLWYQWNRHLLCFFAAFHRKNRDNQEYPQLWNCWPLWTCRWKGFGYCRGEGDKTVCRLNPVFILRTKICGFFTGHEISKTEWGYGGGKFVDRNCRWCDFGIKVPKIEEEAPDSLNGPLSQLGYYK